MADGPAGRRVTVRDIAAYSGVSIATVSRALNGGANVTPETRDLVLRAAERLRAQGPGSRAAGSWAGAARAARGAVYLRCPYLLTDYFGLIVSSVAETLALHGRAVVLDAGTAAQQATLLPSLPSRPGTAGAIVILPPEPGEQLTALRARGFPFVVVDPRTPVPRDIAAVSAAHFAGSRSVTAHLAGLGHRRIGVIAGPRNWLAGQARLAGHAAALAEAGVLHPPELTRADEPTAEFGYRARANCSTCTSVPPRGPASTTRPRSARWPPRPGAACGCPRTFPSPASTTSTWPRPPARCSPPPASPWPRWAG